MNDSFDYTTSSINDTEIAMNLYSEKPELNLPWYFVVTLIIVGSVGNLMVCVSIIVDKKLQNVTNYFLFSLAVTDLLINLIILPARIVIYFYELQPPLFPLCTIYLIGDNYLTAASALHICAIAVERFYAIKNPFNKRFLTKKRTFKRILFIWIVSFLTIIPYLTIVIISDYPSYPSYCPKLLSNFQHFNLILYMEVVVIFTMIGLVFYSFMGTSLVLYRLAKTVDLVRNAGGKNSKLQINSEKKALKVVWIVSFAFVLAMGPYGTVNVVHLIAPKMYISKETLKIVTYLAYSNSVINPILYTVFNKRFRSDFKKILTFKKCW